MKKIICTVTNDLTYDQRMIRICTSLAVAGYEVVLVGRHLQHSVALQEQGFQQKRLRLFFEKGKFFYLEYNLRLFIYLLFQKFDVVCSIDLDSLLAGYFSARVKGKTCVFDAHEYFTEVPEVVERPSVQRVWEMVARFAIPRLKFAYTVCESLAEIFHKKYGTPFNVIRNVPVRRPLPPTKIRLETNPFRLLYQGVLNDGRGLEEMLAAMPLLPDVELWLAGEGDLSDELRKLAAQLGVENRVKFLGKLTPGALALLTPQADVGLNLLKNKGLNYYYSLANKAFDYIQAGIPSLSMDFPEYRKINEQHAVFCLLENLSPRTIANAVTELQRNPHKYEQISTNCRTAAEALTWEKEAEKLLDFYRKVFQDQA